MVNNLMFCLVDFCKPGWHGSRRNCYLFRDDDVGTYEEAKEKCVARNAEVAKPHFYNPNFGLFIQRVCPDCLSMFVGAVKVTYL